MRFYRHRQTWIRCLAAPQWWMIGHELQQCTRQTTAMRLWTKTWWHASIMPPIERDFRAVQVITRTDSVPLPIDLLERLLYRVTVVLEVIHVQALHGSEFFFTHVRKEYTHTLLGFFLRQQWCRWCTKVSQVPFFVRCLGVVTWCGREYLTSVTWQRRDTHRLAAVLREWTHTAQVPWIAWTA